MGLQPGNRKLGPLIVGWSLPAILTCTGRSKLCEKVCYAMRGYFRFKSVSESNMVNWKEYAESADFAAWMSTEIRHALPRVVRVHVAGDFYDRTYAEKWLVVMQKNHSVTFYAYTRAWRDPEIYPTLKLMSRLPNFLLWLSCDKETGPPPRLRRSRRAYMALNDLDSPRFKVDLVFRNTTTTVLKYDPSGALVCPYENGATKTNGRSWPR